MTRSSRRPTTLILIVIRTMNKKNISLWLFYQSPEQPERESQRKSIFYSFLYSSGKSMCLPELRRANVCSSNDFYRCSYFQKAVVCRESDIKNRFYIFTATSPSESLVHRTAFGLKTLINFFSVAECLRDSAMRRILSGFFFHSANLPSFFWFSIIS